MISVAEGHKKFSIGSQWRSRAGYRAVVVAHDYPDANSSRAALLVWYDGGLTDYLFLDGRSVEGMERRTDLVAPWETDSAASAPAVPSRDRSIFVIGRSVLRDWVMALPLRHQGVLIAAVRGCDSTPKENSAKPIVRALRYAFLNPADEREVTLPSAFMSPSLSVEDISGFSKDWDHYPIHFIQHLMHACEVVGYKHPDGAFRRQFAWIYHLMVSKMHLNEETEAEMDARLTEDRIALYGNATGDKI